MYLLVGETGFEPATPRSQTACATGLRHSPSSRLSNSFRLVKAARASFARLQLQPSVPLKTPLSLRQLPDPWIGVLVVSPNETTANWFLIAPAKM